MNARPPFGMMHVTQPHVGVVRIALPFPVVRLLLGTALDLARWRGTTLDLAFGGWPMRGGYAGGDTFRCVCDSAISGDLGIA